MTHLFMAAARSPVAMKSAANARSSGGSVRMVLEINVQGKRRQNVPTLVMKMPKAGPVLAAV